MKRKKNLLILAILLIPVIISIVITHLPGRDMWRRAQEDNVRETVFRNMMARHPGYTYFLSFTNEVSREPVPDGFMARFKGNASVKQISEMGLTETGAFVDKDLYRKTKNYDLSRGASFSVGPVSWNGVTDSLAHVEYSDQGADHPGHGGTCYLLMIGGKCFVMKYTLDAVY